MSGQGAVRLTESERQTLDWEVAYMRHPTYIGDGVPRGVYNAVEAIIAARVRQALHDAWLAVHVRRFDGDYTDRERPDYAEHVRPDNVYHGTIRAEHAITETALTAAPVPPADETGPQAGAGGLGGGGL